MRMTNPLHCYAFCQWKKSASTEEKRIAMSHALGIFTKIRKIDRAKWSLSEYPEEVKHFKETGIELGRLLIEEFLYAEWPNYLQKVIEHTLRVNRTSRWSPYSWRNVRGGKSEDSYEDDQHTDERDVLAFDQDTIQPYRFEPYAPIQQAVVAPLLALDPEDAWFVGRMNNMNWYALSIGIFL